MNKNTAPSTEVPQQDDTIVYEVTKKLVVKNKGIAGISKGKAVELLNQAISKVPQN